MFGQILYTQIKWTRPLLAFVSVVAFGLPVLFWRVGGSVAWNDASALQIVYGFGAFGPAIAILAAATGFLIVAYVWSIDAAARHVYPLSLPITWSRYAAMRFGAGVLTLLLPTIALLLGSLFVLANITLPPTLHAYPFTVALRFFLGATLSFALSFLLQYLMGRRAVVTVAILLFAVLGIGFAADLLGLDAYVAQGIRLLIVWPGPLAVFAAQWALIDV